LINLRALLKELGLHPPPAFEHRAPGAEPRD
jgi:hypothetical protein